MVLATSFAGYQKAGGLQLPTALTTTIDDFTTATIKVAKQVVDGDAGDLAVAGRGRVRAGDHRAAAADR